MWKSWFNCCKGRWKSHYAIFSSIIYTRELWLFLYIGKSRHPGSPMALTDKMGQDCGCVWQLIVSCLAKPPLSELLAGERIFSWDLMTLFYMYYHLHGCYLFLCSLWFMRTTTIRECFQCFAGWSHYNKSTNRRNQKWFSHLDKWRSSWGYGCYKEFHSRQTLNVTCS